MTTIKPYKFDALSSDGSDITVAVNNNSFASFGKKNELVQEITYSRQQLDESEQEGYQRGVIDGTNKGKKESFELDQKVLDSVNTIIPQMNALFQSFAHNTAEHRKQTTELALQIAKKIAGDALTENPLPLIESSVTQCLRFIFDEPNITITVNDSIVNLLKERLDKIILESDFKGKIDIIGNPNTLADSCTVNWQDGGAEISTQQRMEKIEEIIQSINK